MRRPNFSTLVINFGWAAHQLGRAPIENTTVPSADGTVGYRQKQTALQVRAKFCLFSHARSHRVAAIEPRGILHRILIIAHTFTSVCTLEASYILSYIYILYNTHTRVHNGHMSSIKMQKRHRAADTPSTPCIIHRPLCTPTLDATYQYQQRNRFDFASLSSLFNSSSIEHWAIDTAKEWRLMREPSGHPSISINFTPAPRPSLACNSSFTAVARSIIR